MKRFFTVLAAVSLAGAIYVATAPGSQTASPTAKQFKALSTKVAKLQKDETKVKSLAIAEAILLTDCMTKAVPVDQRGDPGATYGYTYTPSGPPSTPVLTTALDFVDPSDQNAKWFAYGTSACGNDLNSSLRKQVLRLSGRH